MKKSKESNTLKMTFEESIFIEATPEVVWDFTQDYSKRPNWDSAVIKTEVISEKPHRVVRVFVKGGTTTAFQYKLDRRPEKTSLQAIEMKSLFFASGGGSWVYKSRSNGTIWTQRNTLAFKNKFLTLLFKPLFSWQITKLTRQSMHEAKKQIENELTK
ncbi:MAG: SRPBCC family protein [Calditrichaeota bacterium]|nr:MAG: SRPBCC family protein [Calditrichota bacterium]